MKKQINNKRLLEKMKTNNIKVVSIDTENMLYICDDSNEYPLLDGMETMTIDELQKHIDNAKLITCNILKQIEEENG